MQQFCYNIDIRLTCFCYIFLGHIEAATRGVIEKKVFLQILQNLQENTCAGVSFLVKLQARGQRCFPVNFANFVRTPFSQNASGRLTDSGNDIHVFFISNRNFENRLGHAYGKSLFRLKVCLHFAYS